MNEYTWPSKTTPAALEYATVRMADLPESWLNAKAAEGWAIEAVLAQHSGYLVILSRPRAAREMDA
jgi:hypothetical protein